MVRRVIAGIIAIGLGLGIWALWPRGDTTPTTTGPPVAGPTTTSRLNSTTSLPPVDTSTTRTTASHVVETVEEAEEILRELWFGWFEGIYNQDEDRIREVVATEELLLAAREAFGSMEFSTPPVLSGITLPDLEILRTDDGCLATWSEIQASFREGSSSGVYIIRWRGDHWAIASVWAYKEDLWDADCETPLGPLP